jgi:hypothetical protein
VTLANRTISNVFVLGGELNVVQPESDPVITSTRIDRASREVQSDVQQRESVRVRALRRRHQKLDDHVNKAEAIRIGAPICDVNAHLHFGAATRIDVWKSDHEHVIDVIPEFTKPNIEGH